MARDGEPVPAWVKAERVNINIGRMRMDERLRWLNAHAGDHEHLAQISALLHSCETILPPGTPDEIKARRRFYLACFDAYREGRPLNDNPVSAHNAAYVLSALMSVPKP